MKFLVITLFPEMFNGILSESILNRAQEKGIFEVDFVNLREHGIGPRRQVDDTPYGGGPGMVLRVDVMAEAIEAAKKKLPKAKILLMTPQGKTFCQSKAQELSKIEEIILVCGHYEGFDERIRALVDEEISIGKFVLTGGEIPAMAIIDSVARLIPGVLGKDESSVDETFANEDEVEYPQYTRPENWQGNVVPDVLLSGNHKQIEDWRKEESVKKTRKYKNSI